jgi:hypothetical protein
MWIATENNKSTNLLKKAVELNVKAYTTGSEAVAILANSSIGLWNHHAVCVCALPLQSLNQQYDSSCVVLYNFPQSMAWTLRKNEIVKWERH